MYSDSTEVVYAAKRLAIRHVRDVVQAEDLSPSVRGQLASELDRAVGRVRPSLADEFRTIYEDEFEDALDWAREQRLAALALQEAERVADDLRRFRIDTAQVREIHVFREPEVSGLATDERWVPPEEPIVSQVPQSHRSDSVFGESRYFLLALAIIVSPVFFTVLLGAALSGAAR